MSSIPINIQVRFLTSEFPKGEVKSESLRHLIWEMNIVPTPNSVTYRVRIDYTLGASPRVYVIDPPFLKRAEGYNRLEHVYDDNKQQICLFYSGEWKPTMLLSRTIIPWASEWLLFYELWVNTGEWLGGGIEHYRKAPFMKKTV